MSSGSGDGSTPERPSTGVTCTFEIPPGTPDEVLRTIDGVDYLLHFRRCTNNTLTIIWVPQLDARDLATQARDQVRRLLPNPHPRFAPQPDRNVVHIGTWIWTDPTTWHPVTATAAIPGLTATATATPTHLRFNPGDGHYGTGAITCPGPGQIWTPAAGDQTPSPCMYTYHHASSLHPTGTWPTSMSIDWRVTFQASDGTTGNLGTLTTTTTQPLRVGEIQALLTNP